MLAGYMPALRVLCVYMSQHVDHDGFIDVVSRLRTLRVHAYPRASLKVADWPAAFPSLEEFVWRSDREEGVLAAEILRRAPFLRSASVPRAAALSAVQGGSVVHALGIPPLLHVRALTLTGVEDGAALVQILAAAPAVTSLTLRCGSDNTLWRALDAALTLVKGASGEGVSGRVRRLRLDTDRKNGDEETRRQLAGCVVRLFPRVRVALSGDVTDDLTGRGRNDEPSSTIYIFSLD
jgi:hypothetical protein